MTLRDLGPQTLVSRSISYQQHQFLMRGLGDISSDIQTEVQRDGHNGDGMLHENFFGKHKNKALHLFAKLEILIKGA
jgi:hypothetical protein